MLGYQVLDLHAYERALSGAAFGNHAEVHNFLAWRPECFPDAWWLFESRTRIARIGLQQGDAGFSAQIFLRSDQHIVVATFQTNEPKAVASYSVCDEKYLSAHDGEAWRLRYSYREIP